MSSHDVIGDMLTKIRNASNAGHKKVLCPYSNIKIALGKILMDQGFVEKAEVIENNNKKDIEVVLKYYNNKPVISGIKRISKPGRRVYCGADEIPRFLNGLALTIVSTSQGVLTGKEAKEKNAGGEVLCYVW
ncbi:MAG TPA: 30S ribosomal protein S8 [Spirochaetia bacterium]|nr:MAG: 30S ribosomal protein S8 [Spirochaetes bacterium GWB1_36_13]HCL57326.1 30S ribosomal protein S8 [Spirochaetia bacterium]